MNSPLTARDASNPENSVWVSANAGSGKTYLLADRVTRLLLAGADPAKILCLTYTKAAAAEMSSRLFDRLGEWALLADGALRAKLKETGADDLGHEALRRARRLFAQALETPGGLKIQTIHSFCQHVLARFPIEARVPSRFTVLDDRTAADLMRASRNAVLQRASEGDETLARAIAVLATRAADVRFAEIVDAAIGNAARLREILAQHDDDRTKLFTTLRKTLAIEPDIDGADVFEQLCAELRLELPLLQKIAAWLLSGKASDQRAGKNLQSFLSDMSVENFDALLKVFLKTDGEPRLSLTTKGTAESNPDLLRNLEILRERVLATNERAKAATTATLTEAIVTVATEVLADYAAQKRLRGALDYDDLTRKTLALLEREYAAAWVLYKLDGGIDHILVDEAQDTSPEQWQIVTKLAEEFYSGHGAGDSGRIRTLFAVGDEKQSIFSFQGAVPEEFGRNAALFRKRAAEARLSFADVRLPVSRRSAKSILSFVDDVFSDEAIREGLSAEGEAPQHEPHRKEIGHVEIWPTVKPPQTTERDPWNLPVDAPSPASADMVLAKQITDRIAHWLDSGVLIGEGERAKPIDPGDIMILVRRRNAFAQEMIRQLMDRKIPVAGADRMVLLDQIAIADLVALGRFVLLPEDDLNLAALLKSPLVGFSEDELYDLAQPRGATLWEALVERQREKAIFAHAQEFLAKALSQADFMPPFEFFANILSNGARRKMLSRFGVEADDAIGEFLSLAQRYEDAHPPSLEGFLDWFSRGAAEVKRDMEQAGGAVRVMTVHGAKGLEAKVVIVPDTAQAPDHAQRAGILYTDNCLYFGVPKTHEPQAVRNAKDKARERELREYRRLLYVALTRARDWLILCGYETKRGIQEGAWHPFLEAAGKRIGREETAPDGEKIIVFGESIAGGRRKELSVSEAPPSLPAFLSTSPQEQPAARRIVRPSDALGNDEPSVVSPLLSEKERRFGRGLLIHSLLALLPELPQEERANAAENYLRMREIVGDDAEGILAETFAILDQPEFSNLFGLDSRGEIAITAELPELGAGLRVSGQIDRLAVCGDDVLVADYKSNRPPPESAEEIPPIYLAQMALYRAALRKIYPGKRVRCLLIWTYAARGMYLPDSLLDAEFQCIKEKQTAVELT